MARTNNLTNFLTDVASAIKEKTGDSSAIPASQFDTKIASIPTGGTYQEKNITITENGNYNLLPDSGYDALSNVRITTNVSGEPMDPTTATINDVINPKTFYSNGQKLTGTIIPTYSSHTETVPVIRTDIYNDTGYTILCYNKFDNTLLVNANGVARIYTITDMTLSNNSYIDSYTLSEDSNVINTTICNTLAEETDYVVVTFYGANTSIDTNYMKVRRINKTTGNVTQTTTCRCTNFNNRNRYSSVRTGIIDPVHRLIGFVYLASSAGAGYTYGMYSDIYRYDYTTNTCDSTSRIQTLLFNHGGNTSTPTGTLRCWFTPNYSYLNCETWGGQSNAACCLILGIGSTGTITELLKYQSYGSPDSLRCIDENGNYYDGTSRIIDQSTSVPTPFNMITAGINSSIGDYLFQQDNSVLRVYKFGNNEYNLFQNINGVRLSPTTYLDRYAIPYNGNDLTVLLRYDTMGDTEYELLSLQRLEKIFRRTDDADAIAGEIVQGKVAYNKNGKVTGSMPNNGTLTYTPTDTAQTIPAGYTSGGTISAVDITNLQEYQDCLDITEDILNGAGSWYERVRYIRWRITGIKSGENVLQASEFGLCKSSSDTTQRYSFPSGTVITSNQTGTTSEGEDVSKLIDGSVDTKYCVSPFTSPCIIDIDLHSTIDLTEYGYYYYYTANDRPSDRDPLQWTLYASDDGETYNLVDTQNLSSVTTDRKALAGIWSMTLQS